MKGCLLLKSKKDRVSLLTILLALLLINLFGDSLNSLIWMHFTLFMNCILVQAVFLQLSKILNSKTNRVLRFVLTLLALLTGLSTFVVILYSPMGSFNRVFFFILQLVITYAEALQLKDEYKTQA